MHVVKKSLLSTRYSAVRTQSHIECCDMLLISRRMIGLFTVLRNDYANLHNSAMLVSFTRFRGLITETVSALQPFINKPVEAAQNSLHKISSLTLYTVMKRYRHPRVKGRLKVLWKHKPNHNYTFTPPMLPPYHNKATYFSLKHTQPMEKILLWDFESFCNFLIAFTEYDVPHMCCHLARKSL